MVTPSDAGRPVLRPLASVRSSTSVDGLVLLDIAHGVILSANPVGARIWHLIEEGTDEAEIAKRVAADCAVAIERVEGDVAAFVHSLIAHGLVEREPVS